MGCACVGGEDVVWVCVSEGRSEHCKKGQQYQKQGPVPSRLLRYRREHERHSRVGAALCMCLAPFFDVQLLSACASGSVCRVSSM
jgi:hypothetical protein